MGGRRDKEVDLSGATYYALLAAGRSRDNPSGVARRRRDGDTVIDEVFTRNLRWDPTDYFDRERLGRNDDEHVEITEAEADEFVQRVTAKRR
ncbi:MAG: hypothetical protein GEU83_00915 [Pseudonocardiaceae bacterium]|nr:hypothetical protein [Pseudonocardiaceae bacterium]